MEGLVINWDAATTNAGCVASHRLSVVCLCVELLVLVAPTWIKVC